jgi:hypothetical protein
LRTGRELTVVNLAACGALVEGVTRLLPNTHTDLHIVTRHGRVLVRARVVRALVWRLERDMVCYRTGLAFDTAVDTDVDPALTGRSPRPWSEAEQSNEAASSESNGPALSEPSSRRPQDVGESNGYAVPTEIPRNISASGTGYPGFDFDARG